MLELNLMYLNIITQKKEVNEFSDNYECRNFRINLTISYIQLNSFFFTYLTFSTLQQNHQNQFSVWLKEYNVKYKHIS